MYKNRKLAIVISMAVLLVTIVLGVFLSVSVRTDNYETQCKAADLMRCYIDQIARYKKEVGLGLSKEDIHQTGLIGDEFTGITTTVGTIEAKRTVSNPDMAALAVRMLADAGVEAGNVIGAAFSGSFPGMNLAFLAASEAMGVRIVYIASVGASMYGANQPELTFPDMVHRLFEDDLVSQPLAAFSMGGDRDCGIEMEPALVHIIEKRLTGYGYPFIHIEDYVENLKARLAIYDAYDINCFVGTGGNITTIGVDEDDMPWGIVRPYTAYSPGEKSGLLEIYNARGLPVIHFVNVKKIVTEYGLAYDPQSIEQVGLSAVYHRTQSPRLVIVVGICVAIGILLWGRWSVKNRNRQT